MGIAAPFGCVTAVYEVAGLLALVGLPSLASFFAASFFGVSFGVSFAAALLGVALPAAGAVFFCDAVSLACKRESGERCDLLAGSSEA